MNLVLSPRACRFTALPAKSTVYDKLIDKDLLLKGGRLYSTNVCIGDSIQIDIVDKDNILEMGGTPDEPVTVMRGVKEWYLYPGVNDLADNSVKNWVMAGLYIRVIYFSDMAAVDATTVVFNFISFEKID